MSQGHTLLIWTAEAARPPSSNFATFDQRNNHNVLDFDDTTAESSLFGSILPRSYDGYGIVATLVWMATTATTGNVKWEMAFERHQDEVDDLDSDSFATAKSVTASAPGTSGATQYSEISFSNSEIDGLLKGESFRLFVRRAAADAADTMTGDAELLRVELREALAP